MEIQSDMFLFGDVFGFPEFSRCADFQIPGFPDFQAGGGPEDGRADGHADRQAVVDNMGTSFV